MNKDYCDSHEKPETRIFIANVDNLGNPILPYFEFDASKLGSREGCYSMKFKIPTTTDNKKLK